MPIRQIVAAVCAGAITVGVLACGGGGKEVLKNSDDAARYIDEVMQGASSSEYTLADDATRTAVVAMDDSGPLTKLRDGVDAAPGQGCQVVGVINDVADSAPDSTEPVLDAAELIDVSIEVKRLGIQSEVRAPIVDAALDMAESTWVDAADLACNI
jgi:hypothetical protein